VKSQSGKQVFAPQYRLLKNRDFLIVSPLELNEDSTEFLIEENDEKVNFPLNLKFTPASKQEETSNLIIFVAKDKLKFPLILRHWNEGDVFLPLGMQGKSKKVSKFFKDEKLSLIEKENTWLLCSNNKIVWVVGMRQDERFKIDSTTKNILKIEIEE
jgi:tRNA(Ile)-lysidine synthase